MRIVSNQGTVIVTAPEQEKEDLPKNFEILADENAELLFRNAMQDMQIQALQDENAELLFRVATIELGGIL